eukprot:5894751-Amphidinium_carterae.5
MSSDEIPGKEWRSYLKGRLIHYCLDGSGLKENIGVTYWMAFIALSTWDYSECTRSAGSDGRFWTIAAKDDNLFLASVNVAPMWLRSLLKLRVMAHPIHPEVNYVVPRDVPQEASKLQHYLYSLRQQAPSRCPQALMGVCPCVRVGTVIVQLHPAGSMSPHCLRVVWQMDATLAEANRVHPVHVA